MDKEVVSLLNGQINQEFFSAYFYLAIAGYYEEKGLTGFANWFEVQAKEEQDHAMLMYRYLHNNQQKVIFTAIAESDNTFESLIAPVKSAFAHEQYITARINAIYAAAHKVNDYRTMQFLDWFVKEQGEEEKNSSDLILKMEFFGDDSRSLYLLNTELQARAYTPPSLVL
jgi:ferritin